MSEPYLEHRLAWPILVALCRWPGANRSQLARLVEGPTPSLRQVRDALACLQRLRLATLTKLPEGRSFHYTPTRRALRAFASLGERHSAAVASTTVPVVLRGYHRAQLRLALEERGYRVGQDATSLAVLYRFLLEHSDQALRRSIHVHLNPELDGRPRPSMLYRCPRCGVENLERFEEHERGPGQICDARPRQMPLLRYTLATKQGRTPLLLLVDDPNKSILRQVNELPVTFVARSKRTRRAVYPPRLPIVFVPSDDGSIYDDATAEWVFKGPRLRSFEALATRAPRSVERFPFHRTVQIVPLPRGVFFHRTNRAALAQEVFSHA